MSIIFQQAANTVALTPAGTHDTDLLPRPSGNSGPMVACVLNNATTPAFIAFGASTVEASPTSATIAVGERAFFMVPQGATHVSVESVGTPGTGDVYVTLGYASNAH
jgi:hypothetical protein